MPFLAAAIALLLVIASGEGLLLLLRLRSSEESVLSRLFAAFAVGIAVCGTWSLLLALLHVRATAFLLATPVLLYPAGRILVRRGAAQERASPARGPSHKLLATIAALVVVAESAYVFHQALLRPVHGWDAWRIWSFRAKVLFLERGFPQDFFTSDWAGFPGYPLGIPFVEAFLAQAIGFWHGPAIKMIFPLFYVGLLWTSYVLIRGRAGRDAALTGLLLLAPAPLLVHHGTIAYMDLPLSFFLLGAVLYGTLWRESGSRGDLLLAALHAGFLPQIKNEGLPLYIVLTVWVALAARKEGGLPRRAALWFAASLPLSLPWLLFKYAAGVPDSPYHTLSSPGLSAVAGRLVDLLRLTGINLFLSGSWGIAWYSLLLLLIPRRRRGAGAAPFVLAGGALVFAAAYLFTESYSFLVNGTALARNLLVLLPLAVATGLCSLGGGTARSAARPVEEKRRS
jgi:hypothetical protein